LPILKNKPPITTSAVSRVARARDCSVGEIRSAHFGQGHDAPDVHLHDEVDENRDENGERDAAASVLVKVAVCVMNPGLIAEVAIKKMAAVSQAWRLIWRRTRSSLLFRRDRRRTKNFAMPVRTAMVMPSSTICASSKR
jgi:hypothetical protein